MNKVYRIKWCESLNAWVVCSELGRKTKSRNNAIMFTFLFLFPSMVFALDCNSSSNGIITVNNENNTGIYQNCEISFFSPNIAGNPWSVAMLVFSGANTNRSITVTNDIDSVLKLGTGISVYGSAGASFNAENNKITLNIENTDSAPANGDAIEKVGLGVSHGATAKIGTFDVTMNNLPIGSYEHYGVVAGSSVAAGETIATNGIYSEAQFDNLNIQMSGAGSYVGGYPLVAGIRVIQGANQNSGNGSAGLVKVNEKLDININNGNKNIDATGIYLSGSEKNGIRPEVRLKNSNITISSTSSRAHAILLGKTSITGRGGGDLYSSGEMVLDTTKAKNSSAINIVWQGSKIVADTSTAKTIIKAGKEAIYVSGSSLYSTGKTETLFNNLIIDKTETLTASLVKVAASQKDYIFSVKGAQSQLISNTGNNAYLIDVQGSSTDTASNVTYNFSEGYMQGLTRKASASSLDINLSNYAVWQLDENLSSQTSSFTTLNLDNSQVNATVLNNSNNALSKFILSGNVVAKSSQFKLDNNIAGDSLKIDGNLTTGNNLWVVDSYLTGTGQSQDQGQDGKSYTDKIVITGSALDSGLGADKVKVNNLASSASTGLESILVFDIAGQSNATFELKDRVVSGAYEYLLNKHANGNWYLESKLTRIAPIAPVYRPELGGYLANAYGANNLFVHRLEDRNGASQYTNNNDKQFWIRAQGGELKFSDSNHQLNTNTNQYLIHAGLGLAEFGSNKQYNIGVMGAWGAFDSKSISEPTHYQSKGTAKGFGVGLYGTWFESLNDEFGKYVDAWAMWNHFRNNINGETLSQSKYKASGLIASVELGDTFEMSKNSTKKYWLQPQLQIVYQDVQTENFKEDNGTHVSEVGANIQSRVGVKLFKTIPSDVVTRAAYRPYVALNWINNSKTESIQLNEENYGISGNKNLVEVKLGLEGKISKSGHVWLNLAYQTGSDDFNNAVGNIGWKWSF